MVKDLIAGARSFDVISTISNLIFDADGFTDLVALLEREAILLAFEYENNPVAKAGSSKEALITRAYALAALTDATYASINDFILFGWEFYTTGTTGMFHMLFGDDTILADIRDAENQIYLLRREISSVASTLHEMIQNCPDLN